MQGAQDKPRNKTDRRGRLKTEEGLGLALMALLVLQLGSHGFVVLLVAFSFL